jgi:hypothetical protein
MAGEAGFEESYYAAPMLLDTDGQIAKGFKPAEFGAFAPPSQGGFIFVRQDVLKHVSDGRYHRRNADSPHPTAPAKFVPGESLLFMSKRNNP